MRTIFLSRTTMTSIAFLLGVPLAAHLLFSRLGFNPTDDGFTLAYARRLLAGQIPHRDFIIIRPCLSPLLHTPVVLWGGEYTYWVSRLTVWCQLALIARTSVVVVGQLLDRSLTATTQLWLSLIVFAFTAHYFPIMAWHTIDGLLLSVLGLLLIGRGGDSNRLIGYALLGAACLCKQSFVLLPPGVLFLYGDWRRLRHWLAVVLPGVVYLLIILLTGALAPALSQLFSQRGLLVHGVLAYCNYLTGLGVICGGVSAWILLRRPDFLTVSWLGRILRGVLLTIFYVCPLAGASLAMATGNLGQAAFGLFGMAGGFLLLVILGKREIPNRQIIRTGLLVLLLTWSTSLSIGYNSPALGAGLLVLFGLMSPWPLWPRRFPQLRHVVLILATVAALTGFWFARRTHIYREQRSPQLTCALDEALPGGRLLLTNPNTFAFLNDLNLAIAQAEARKLEYVILPEIAGHWVKAPQLNPLPIDWVMSTELGRPRLIARVLNELVARRGEVLIIVQRIKTSSLHEGFVAWPAAGFNEVDAHVIANFERVGATEYFDLYK